MNDRHNYEDNEGFPFYFVFHLPCTTFCKYNVGFGSEIKIKVFAFILYFTRLALPL